MKPYGELSVLEILTHSSNIGATKLAERLEAQRWWEYLNAFGFGQKTAIDLPGEVEGRLRPWRQWARVALGTHAFGQGFSVTTLQLATAFAALANGGFLLEPFVVREVRDEAGRVVQVRHPEVLRRVISQATAGRVLAVLEAVVETGTGKGAKVPGFRVGGKTGTAQKVDPNTHRYSTDRCIVSFVGVVPVDEPQLVIAVVLNEVEWEATGGRLAAPVFQKIAASSLHYLQVPAEMPAVAQDGPALPFCSASDGGTARPFETVEAAWADSQAAWRMPDLRSLAFRSAFRALEGLPVRIRVKGSGRVLEQDPPPGTAICEGQVVRLSGLPSGRIVSETEETGKK
jgi:cell division protein FtsI (penicillin-binding protein 3)